MTNGRSEPASALAQRLDDLAVVLAVLLQVGKVVIERRMDDAVGQSSAAVAQAVQVVHIAAADLRARHGRAPRPPRRNG